MFEEKRLDLLKRGIIQALKLYDETPDCKPVVRVAYIFKKVVEPLLNEAFAAGACEELMEHSKRKPKN